MIKSFLEDEENRPLETTSEIESGLAEETTLENSSETNLKQTSNSFDKTQTGDIFNFTLDETPKINSVEPIFQTDFKPESFVETTRKSGLAYAAAITLFGSIVFLMALGWFADLLLGTSPWGIVVGIVLGSIIGFYQFFRLTSQILKDKD